MTAKQKRFCDEYLIDLNATQAAIRAGYSKKTANRIGTENLSKPVIKQYIDERMAEKDKELIAEQDEVLKFLTSVMRGKELDERKFVNEIGDLESYNIKVQANQIKAAELLGKAYGLYKDKVDVDSDMDININIDYGEKSGLDD